MTKMLLLAAIGAGLLMGQQKPRVEGPFPAKEGETCVVCNSKLDANDLAFVVDGQRIGVARGMEEEFLQNPLAYVTKLRPQGLVTSGTQGSSGGSMMWGGVFVVVGLMFGAACAHLATAKGRSPWGWFFLGFVFSAPACLVLATRPAGEGAPGETPAGLGKIPTTREPVPCRACGAANHPAAARCSSCGASLEPTAPSEVPAGRS